LLILEPPNDLYVLSKLRGIITYPYSVFNYYSDRLLGKTTVNTKKKEVLLFRRPYDGSPNIEYYKNAFNENNMDWHSQLLDRRYNGFISVEPKIRSEYLRKRIVFIKTLWDISTNFRARRMKEILEMCENIKK